MKGKVALISGGSRGIGRAIALSFAKAGADVAILYAGNTQAAEQTVEDAKSYGVRAQCYLCDVADYEVAARVVKAVNEELGPVYTLVNNAGVTRDKLVAQMSGDDFSHVLATNLTGAFNLIRHTYGGFLRRREGRIINISSVVGLTGNAGQANYAASKAGLIGLTKSVAKELGARGITCNAIAPGFILSDMTDAMPQQAKEGLLAAIPARRPGNPEEVADLALFLASSQAAYITGAVIPVDGGLSM